MVEKILNNTTPYGKIRASHEGSLHSSTLSGLLQDRTLHAVFAKNMYHITHCDIPVDSLDQTFLAVHLIHEINGKN